jgi:phospholipid-translocating ATPase
LGTIGHQRDREVNSQKYKKLIPDQLPQLVPSSKLKVGDIIIVEKDERVPADLVLLRTSDKSGAVFVRTDQLDGELRVRILQLTGLNNSRTPGFWWSLSICSGETDWKLRLAVSATQKLVSDSELFNIGASIYIEKPQKDIHSFIGTFSKVSSLRFP